MFSDAASPKFKFQKSLNSISNHTKNSRPTIEKLRKAEKPKYSWKDLYLIKMHGLLGRSEVRYVRNFTALFIKVSATAAAAL